MRLFLILCLMATASLGRAQGDEVLPPFKKYPTLPPMDMLGRDSMTVFTKDSLKKGVPTVVIVFSPECSHCQHETEQILAAKDQFKNVQFLMVTFLPLYKLNDFVTHYKLDQEPNFILGKDIHFTAPAFYGISNLPFVAMYDKDGKLLGNFEGSYPISEILKFYK